MALWVSSVELSDVIVETRTKHAEGRQKGGWSVVSLTEVIIWLVMSEIEA